MEKKRYYLSSDSWIAGVCAGLAEYFTADVLLIRILFLISFLCGFGISFWLYIAVWILAPSDRNQKNTDADRDDYDQCE